MGAGRGRESWGIRELVALELEGSLALAGGLEQEGSLALAGPQFT